MAKSKGMAGKRTGGTARKQIKRLRNSGMSYSAIGKRTNRTGGTISAIASGEIKNPPSTLVKRLRSIKPKKK